MHTILRRAAGLLLCLSLPALAAGPPLPAFNAPIAETSISGVSSGAYMAVQFGVAWSSIIKGVGAIAGGPFGCSGGSGATALSTCTGGAPPIGLDGLLRQTEAWSGAGAIDATTNLVRQRIYLFNGYNDAVVARSVTNALAAFYQHYAGDGRSLFYQTAIGAGHAMVTLKHGGACNMNGGEHINNCRYDQAGIILQHIYGALLPPNRAAPSGRVVAFNQAEFTGADAPSDDSLDDTGYVFIPAACAGQAPCRVHVALHGCLQSAGLIHQDFVRFAGYNEWADSNGIIVLYPQTTSLGLTNPEACWDWWGYLDANPTEQPHYLLKSGKQIVAIKRMIDRLTSGAAALKTTPAPLPGTLVVVDTSDISVDLAWASVPGGPVYTIARAGASDPAFKRVGSTTNLSFADSVLKPGTAYRYQVTPAGSPSMSVTASTRRKAPVCDDPGNCPVR